jgi:hypothetical protein
MIEWVAWHATISFNPNQPVGVIDEESVMPAGFELAQNFPNPFNSSTTIRYRISSPVHVSLKVYDLVGQEIATLIDHPQTAGNRQVTWHADDLPSGIYFYRLSAGGLEKTRRLILLK